MIALQDDHKAALQEAQVTLADLIELINALIADIGSSIRNHQCLQQHASLTCAKSSWQGTIVRLLNAWNADSSIIAAVVIQFGSPKYHRLQRQLPGLRRSFVHCNHLL